MTHKTLRELWRTDRAAADAIIDAIDRGDPVEVLHGTQGIWFTIDSIILINLDAIHRLAPRDPIIDWSQIGAEIVAFAMDYDGKWVGFYVPPLFNGEHWASDVPQVGAALWPKAFTPGHGIDPKYSLRLRPKEVE